MIYLASGALIAACLIAPFIGWQVARILIRLTDRL